MYDCIIRMSPENEADLKMILCSGYSPLTGFMCAKDYDRVVKDMRLANGLIWPIPIVLDVEEQTALQIKKGDVVTLVSNSENRVGILHVQDVYAPDIQTEFANVLGCKSLEDELVHPWSKRIHNMYKNGKRVYYVGGRVEKGPDEFQKKPFDYMCMNPKVIKQKLSCKGPIIGIQTRNPLHGCHIELIKRAMRSVSFPSTSLVTSLVTSSHTNKQSHHKSHVLLQPVVGPTQNGDVPPEIRVKCYQEAIETLEDEAKHRVTLALLPLAMRMAGPREALWHAIIRKNYGCTHFVVGRDHAGPSTKRANGSDWYGSTEAQDFVCSFEDEIGINIIRVGHLYYVPSCGSYLSNDEFADGEPTECISGTQFRHMLQNCITVPSWFSPPSVVRILQEYYRRGGICVYLTGLSCAGKTTLAININSMIQERLPPNRTVTILDGDVVRTHISKGLGFSREDRSTNVRRIGFVATEIVKHGGIVIVSNISPFKEDRIANRNQIVSVGGTYIQVFVDTPLNVCEKRDVKGLYKKARTGAILEFTGISSPYERPVYGEDMFDTDFVAMTDTDVETTSKNIFEHIIRHTKL